VTQDEIRKLLGGYATNALSAEERSILFEAALEDQELFNALQDEGALRELLADPVTREQLRRALEDSDRQHRRARFSWRRWVFGVAVPAMAAVVVIAVMNRGNMRQSGAPAVAQPEHFAVQTPAAPPPAQVPAAPPAAPVPAPPAAPAPATKQFAADGAPARKIPAPAQLESARAALPAAKSLVAAPAPIPEAVRQQFSAGFAAGVASNAPLYQGTLVRYSLLRSGPQGSEIQVEFTAGLAGYVALYRVNAQGKPTRVYPVDGANDVATPVYPEVTMRIPDSPMQTGNAGERLRLVVVPATPAGVGGNLGGALNGTALGTGAAPFQVQSTPVESSPLVIDIPLAP